MQCQKDFITNGILVSQPIVQDSKYDFIIDLEGKLLRIQCKTSSLSEDGNFITFKAKSTNIRTMKELFNLWKADCEAEGFSKKDYIIVAQAVVLFSIFLAIL